MIVPLLCEIIRNFWKFFHVDAKFSLCLTQQAPGPQYAAAGAQFPGAGYYAGAQPQAAAGYPGYPGYTG